MSKDPTSFFVIPNPNIWEYCLNLAGFINANLYLWDGWHIHCDEEDIVDGYYITQDEYDSVKTNIDVMREELRRVQFKGLPHENH